MKVKTRSAGLVVTHQVNHECRYLLLRAYNYWDFPKGIVELTEDPIEAARREVEEETSLRSLDFPWGQVFRETEPYGAGKVARYYLAATQEVAVTLAVSMDSAARSTMNIAGCTMARPGRSCLRGSSPSWIGRAR